VNGYVRVDHYAPVSDLSTKMSGLGRLFLPELLPCVQVLDLAALLGNGK